MGTDLRKASWEKVTKLRLPKNENLPSLGEVKVERTENEIFGRLLCLLPLAATAYGFPRVQAIEWIVQEELKGDLIENELHYLETGEGDTDTYKHQIEAMWALAWALKVTPNLDFKKNCPNNFVAMLPDLKKMESSEAFRSKISLRKDEEIISHCDFVYCLHWAIRQTELEGKKIPLKIPPFVVPERRKALDWIISKDDWYEIPLDT